MKRSHSKARALPYVPRTTPSILGPIPLVRVRHLKISGKRCYGGWNEAQRKMLLDPNQAPTRAWQTYWHEWLHAVLSDAGVKLPKRTEEAVADAVANARVREMLDAPKTRKR